MKAAEFRYECPANLEDALAWLADDALDVAPLAGGQSLMPMMNFRLARPDVLLDLNRVQGFDAQQVLLTKGHGHAPIFGPS